MAENDIERFTTDDLTSDKIEQLIHDKRSFQVVAIKDMGFVINKLEGAIEKQNLKCRVYTGYRGVVTSAVGAAGVAGAALGTALTISTATAAALSVGIYGGIAVAGHRLFTYNPDYEIEKNQINKSLKVIYKRDVIKEETN